MFPVSRRVATKSLRASSSFEVMGCKKLNLSVVQSRAIVGVSAVPVSVEIHLSGGLPSLSIVGMPETAVRESKAVSYTHLTLPTTPYV